MTETVTQTTEAAGGTSAAPDGPRKGAILGHPVGHSRSPDLHLAAYRALGLDGWTYERVDCTGEQLPAFVDGLGPEWVGLSVTMPGKVAALAYATERTRRAELIGSANTLVRIPGGWRADCTDVDGVTGALEAVGAAALAGRPAVVIGAGGTARPSIAALAEAGAGSLSIVARDRGRAADVLELAAALELDATFVDITDTEAVRAACAAAGVTVSTVPAVGAAPVAAEIAACPAVVDVIYNPWPTPLAEAVMAAGGRLTGGLTMLLCQAFGQVEQFTGRPAPREAMTAALS